jgi:hypothetical protein
VKKTLVLLSLLGLLLFRNRVKTGLYRAEIVLTEKGQTRMIDRDSLTTDAPTTAPQQAVSEVPAAQQKALQELARAIVREAGIVQDPEVQAGIEGAKLMHETAKTQALITAGLLAASGAAWFIPNPEYVILVIGAFVFALASMSGALTYMYFLANEVWASQPPRNLWAQRTADLLSVMGFSVGAGLLALYVVLNSTL